jgi:hypothetical protein
MGKKLLGSQICKFASDVYISDDHGCYFGEWCENKGKFVPHGVGVFVRDENMILIGNFDGDELTLGSTYLRI